MANVFNVAKLGIANGTIDLDTDTFDMLLLTTSPAATLTGAQYDLTTVTGVLGDAGFVEAADSSYTTTTNGRRNVVVTTATQNDTSDEAEAKYTPDGSGGAATWTSLDNDLITGCLVYKRDTALGSANDGAAIPVAFCDLTSNVQANGGDVTIDFTGDIWLTLGN